MLGLSCGEGEGVVTDFDALAAVTKRGDPDFTRDEFGNPRLEMCPVTGVDGPCEWYCTRPAGHTGRHVAGTGRIVAGAWGNGEVAPCASCNRDTGSDAVCWCTEDCQMRWITAERAREASNGEAA